MTKKAPKRYMTKARKTRLVSEAGFALGRIGGKARAERMSPEERRASALKVFEGSRCGADEKSERADSGNRPRKWARNSPPESSPEMWTTNGIPYR